MMTALRRVMLLSLAMCVACSSSPADPDESGLRPGTYDMVFAVPDAVTVPEALRGQHNLSFRVAAPASSPEDMSLVSSRRSPPEGPVVRDYLVLDRASMIVDESRWAMRFDYRDGGFSVWFTVRDAGYGGYRIPNGCVALSDGGASYLASGCRLDRR